MRTIVGDQAAAGDNKDQVPRDEPHAVEGDLGRPAAPRHASALACLRISVMVLSCNMRWQ